MSSSNPWDMYTPLVPSPLNPDVQTDEPPRTPPPGSASQKRLSSGRVDLSPTERLLRYKAAIAWESSVAESKEREKGVTKLFEDKEPRAVVDERSRPTHFMRHPIHRAHWEAAGAEENDIFSASDIYGEDGEDEEKREWSMVALGLQPSRLKATTGRLLLLSFIFFGGCLPALALFSSVSPSVGLWSLPSGWHTYGAAGGHTSAPN